MRYSYEFKLECVQFYKETGTYPQHPRKSNNILLDIKLENGQECMINTDLIS